MKFKGRAWKFGSNIDTDAIIPARYLNVSDPGELAQHCMENENVRFNKEVKEGDMIVAETNFGCGSSREHAPIAIKAKKVSCVIAKSFARIFYRNAFNMGLPIIECDEAVDEIQDGHELEVDLEKGEIKNKTTGGSFMAHPIPPFMQEIIDDGGLMEHIAKRKGQIPKTYEMGVIPRDGTGPEVIAEGLKVLEAVAETADMEYNIVHYGLVELTRESRMRIHVRK